MSLYCLVSPAKTLDMAPTPADLPWTIPELLDHACELIGLLRGISPSGLEGLMSISPALAQVNFQRFLSFSVPFTPQHCRPAVLMFRGDTYRGLQAWTLTRDQLLHVQRHLTILSGLYGVLRPLDLVFPYRLEMKTPLATQRGVGLVRYWGALPAQVIARRAREVGAEAVVNCASDEYFRAVDLTQMPMPVITPIFQESRDGGPRRGLSMPVKRLRGRMARRIITEGWTRPEQIQAFDEEGFRYRPEFSTPEAWVYLRCVDSKGAASSESVPCRSPS
ncbi:MAG: peroxide stress protein YaaA [Magnetococcus sp. WYHC-3]